jgi:hypothetical protein
MLSIIAFALFAATSDMESSELSFDESMDLPFDEESEIVFDGSLEDSDLPEIEDFED